MKGIIQKTFSNTLLILSFLLLQSCGGSSVDNTVYSISADINSADFSNEYSQDSTESIAIKVNFDGEGLLVGFASESEETFWLTHRTENITATSATIHIDVVNVFDEGRLPPDLYNTTLRLATTNAEGSKLATHDIDISLLIWNIAVNTEQVNFSATFGDAMVSPQQIEIITDNEWIASTDESWISLDTTSGNGNATITVNAATSHTSEPGLLRGNIFLTEATSGDSKTIPVQLALDNIYLYAETPAIALTKTANISATEKTITISNNSEVMVDWKASTDAEWLTLTPIGESQLKISANVEKASVNETSSAVITISATDEMIVISESIKVDFYHSDLTTENKLIEPLAISDDAMILSPSLPLFYLAKNNSLHTYNLYTAELESSLVVSQEASVLEQLIIHPNGDYLLAKAIETITNEDGTTTEITQRYRINLLDSTIQKINDTTINSEPIAIVRLSGRYFVLTQIIEFADEQLKVLFLDNENAYFASKVDIATHTNSLFGLDNNNVSFKRHVAQINDFGENRILSTLTHTYRVETLGEGEFISDFIVSNDESSINLISKTSEWINFDGTTFTDNGLLESNEDVVSLFLVKSQDSFGNSGANYLRIDPTQPDGFYVGKYNEQQVLTDTIFTEGNQPSNVQLSADSQRLVINANRESTPEPDARIELVSLHP